VAEGARLESVCTGNRTQGSNPCLSARRENIWKQGADNPRPFVCYNHNMTTIKIHTDGGCDHNPGGTGGWAYRLSYPGGEIVEDSGRVANTTNNRMEMTAALRALEALPKYLPPDKPCQVELYSDSQYLVRGMNEWLAKWQRQGWKLRDGGDVKNTDLWKRLLDLEPDCDLSWIWVRGHNVDPDNIRVDHLVQEAIQGRKLAPAATAQSPVPAEVKLVNKGKGNTAVTITTPSRTTPGKKVSVRVDLPHLQKLIEDLIKAQREGEDL
jgi:ribonuclease HI